MTEPKSPREIAEAILADASIVTYRHVSYMDGTSSEEHNKPREMLLSEIEQALLSYAAERERLLASAETTIADMAGRYREFCNYCQGNEAWCNNVPPGGCALTEHQRRKAHILRSRPATEGKREDD